MKGTSRPGPCLASPSWCEDLGRGVTLLRLLGRNEGPKNGNPICCLSHSVCDSQRQERELGMCYCDTKFLVLPPAMGVTFLLGLLLTVQPPSYGSDTGPRDVAPMDTGIFVLNTVGTHTNCGEPRLEGYRNSGRLSSPPFSRPSLVDTSWFFWLPITCSPQPPPYSLSLPSSLTKLGSLPRDFSLRSLQAGFPSSSPSGVLRILALFQHPALLYLL